MKCPICGKEPVFRIWEGCAALMCKPAREFHQIVVMEFLNEDDRLIHVTRIGLRVNIDKYVPALIREWNRCFK